ncbi:MAG TPA: preprotein translocase subunit YajC [Candidatus Enterenecus stercoripullorum]|nr:preprotein translocase subunit YajC [Candidatus Enterenecus stercoripullorum]
MPFHFNILALSAGSDPSTQGSIVPTIVMLLAMVAVFYFFIIRPESKKKKAANEMRESLKVGDEITTIGGIVGTICALKEETIVMETGADRVRIEFTRWAISSKGTQKEENTAPPMEKELKEGNKKGKEEDKENK